MNTLIIKGHFVDAPIMGKLRVLKNQYLVAEDGIIKGIYPVLPEALSGLPVTNWGDGLIVPGFSDLHLHAPQYSMLGLGMDLQLLEWLDTYTFKNEARYQDPEFAQAAYRQLAGELIKKGTTRVCMFSSLHREATHILMEELSRAGVCGYVGKVNMDRNCPDYYREDTDFSLRETRRWIEEGEGLYQNIAPIITPRFTPSCSDELMAGLGELAEEFGLRTQSHLSENLDEIAWVKSLRPDCEQYWESYATMGLFSSGTAMAHCVYSDARERAAMAEHGVWAVHCPVSNNNIVTGIAPVRSLLCDGVNVALGSDIAGGSELSMRAVATAAVRASKSRWLISEGQEAFLSAAEAFYLITSAGQRFFGEQAGFAPGNSLHALVLLDETLPHSRPLSMEERLERLLYLCPDDTIAARYSAGKLY